MRNTLDIFRLIKVSTEIIIKAANDPDCLSDWAKIMTVTGYVEAADHYNQIKSLFDKYQTYSEIIAEFKPVLSPYIRFSDASYGIDFEQCSDLLKAYESIGIPSFSAASLAVTLTAILPHLEALKPDIKFLCENPSPALKLTLDRVFERS